MSIFDNLLGNQSDLSDKDIALDMLKDSKFNISTLSKAATEAVNPQLRQILNSQLSTSINEHYQLSDILISKNWYPAYADPNQQVKDEYNQAKEVTEQNGQ